MFLEGFITLYNNNKLYGLVFYEYRKSYNYFVFIFKGSICFDVTVVLIVSYRMFREEVIRLSLYFGGPELQYNNIVAMLAFNDRVL